MGDRRWEMGEKLKIQQIAKGVFDQAHSAVIETPEFTGQVRRIEAGETLNNDGGKFGKPRQGTQSDFSPKVANLGGERCDHDQGSCVVLSRNGEDEDGAVFGGQPQIRKPDFAGTGFSTHPKSGSRPPPVGRRKGEGRGGRSQ